MNKCLERVNDRHFWNRGVFSYTMIPRCFPHSRVMFFIVTSIVYGRDDVEPQFQQLSSLLWDRPKIMKVAVQFFFSLSSRSRSEKRFGLRTLASLAVEPSAPESKQLKSHSKVLTKCRRMTFSGLRTVTCLWPQLPPAATHSHFQVKHLKRWRERPRWWPSWEGSRRRRGGGVGCRRGLPTGGWPGRWRGQGPTLATLKVGDVMASTTRKCRQARDQQWTRPHHQGELSLERGPAFLSGNFKLTYSLFTG